MLQIKQTKGNKNEIVVEKKPKMQMPSATQSSSIITYSPSKFIARAGSTYTKLPTHTQSHTHANKTNTNITRSAAPAAITATATMAKIAAPASASNANNSTSYYVVKAGQLGSAASILSSPPKAAAAAAATATTVTAPISTESVIISYSVLLPIFFTSFQIHQISTHDSRTFIK